MRDEIASRRRNDETFVRKRTSGERGDIVVVVTPMVAMSNLIY